MVRLRVSVVWSAKCWLKHDDYFLLLPLLQLNCIAATTVCSHHRMRCPIAMWFALILSFPFLSLVQIELVVPTNIHNKTFDVRDFANGMLFFHREKKEKTWKIYNNYVSMASRNWNLYHNRTYARTIDNNTTKHAQCPNVFNARVNIWKVARFLAEITTHLSSISTNPLLF